MDLLNHKFITHTSYRILNIEKECYQEIYKNSNPNKIVIKVYVMNTECDHIPTDKEGATMEGSLSFLWCTDSLFEMKLNKAPGIDELRVEFYRTFLEHLKEFVLKRVVNKFTKIRGYFPFT